MIPSFSPNLERKIQALKSRRQATQLGQVGFASPLLLAPMSAICTGPFRKLMEDLGAGGTVSELISCHGINYKNEKTREMLKLFPGEENVGIQLFGEDADSMASAAQVAESFGPKFIDINMGCPVKKVVTKGGGSALLKDEEKLPLFFRTIKKSLKIPLTIKIRTGWDMDNRNADRIIKMAHDEGVEFVGIHGRTRTQQYTGKADWNYLEDIAQSSPLPILGNGDLHTPGSIRHRSQTTKTKGLLIARGCLRNPFIFLEAEKMEGEENLDFNASDYWEVLKLYLTYMQQVTTFERTLLVQFRKTVIWYATGFHGASEFRERCFAAKDLDEVMAVSEEFFMGPQLHFGNRTKYIAQEQHDTFMNGGHG